MHEYWGNADWFLCSARPIVYPLNNTQRDILSSPSRDLCCATAECEDPQWNRHADLRPDHGPTITGRRRLYGPHGPADHHGPTITGRPR